ncbi:MAG: hypothetical protein M0R37_08570 [Bacteroidales bacterium]|nr:hypothetical protein [Bacteroidales bacterium]
MKTKKNLLWPIAVLMALVIGFLIGISVEYPVMNSDDLQGTIGKVKSYRNAKASEADIKLKDQILSDTVMAKNIEKYMNLQYVKAVRLSETIKQALTEIEKDGKFKESNAVSISEVGKYRDFLETAKQNFLLTVAACYTPKDVNPALLRYTINRSREVIAQIEYGNKSVVELIAYLESYLKNGQSDVKNLAIAHDLLLRNQIGTAIVFRDKPLIKYFDKTQMFCVDAPSDVKTDIEASVKKDVESLKGIELIDSEKLGIVMDSEKLGLIYLDANGLNSFLNSVSDMAVKDLENLGSWDAEKLGNCLWDNESLGLVNDMESLGACFI